MRLNQHEPIFFTPPCDKPDKRRRLHGGGDSGGGATYYANAERLYGTQADTADFMLGIGKGELPGAVDRYKAAALQYQEPAYADRMAGEAATTAQRSIDQTTGTMTRNMARYGINPASGKWAGMNNTNAIQGAAIKAGAVNQSRTNVEDKKFGAAKDYYSSMVGMPSDSAAQAGQAASGFASIGNAKANQEQNDSAAMGNIASLGYQALTMKDGGEVKGYGVRMAHGGLFSAGSQPMNLPPTTRPVQQQQQVPMNGMKTTAQLATKGPEGFANQMSAQGGKIMENVGGMTGNTELAAQGVGTQATAAGSDLTGAIQSYKSAGMNEAASGLAAGAGDAGTIAFSTSAEQGAMLAAQNAGLAGAEAATASALGGSAAAGSAGAAGAAGAAGGAMAGLATAMPWLAAGYAVGSVLGLFADGGEVDRKNMIGGGDVSGPGGETDDKIPAWLSDGEFVVNAESVKMPGVKKMLKRVNDAGLEKRGYGVRKYADGGFVDKVKSFFKSDSGKTEAEKKAELAKSALGNGMAAKAVGAIKNRQQQIDEEMKKQLGYGCGGMVKRSAS